MGAEISRIGVMIHGFEEVIGRVANNENHMVFFLPDMGVDEKRVLEPHTGPF